MTVLMNLLCFRNQGARTKASTTEKFALVNRAFAVLSDEKKRQAYDRYGAEGAEAVERAESEQAQEHQDDLYYEVPQAKSHQAVRVEIEVTLGDP